MQNLAGKDADGNQLPLNNEVYKACMPPGKNWRKRGWGHGVTSSIINGSHCSRRNNSSDRIQSLEKQMSQMEDDFQQCLEGQKAEFQKAHEEELERRM